MAIYKSKFKGLGFYVDGKLERFKDGRFITTDKDVMEVLDQIQDVTKEKETKKPVKSNKAEEKTGTSKKDTKSTSAKK